MNPGKRKGKKAFFFWKDRENDIVEGKIPNMDNRHRGFSIN
ncbi:hypothetical protein SDC9_119893 [bioreactor metagenome]|uniref:Uncharacterized protein n=1 Tax=bioreactor metagenome TaxID=1076179 RepID=A0A645C6X5_9ZZZZ